MSDRQYDPWAAYDRPSDDPSRPGGDWRATFDRVQELVERTASGSLSGLSLRTVLEHIAKLEDRRAELEAGADAAPKVRERIRLRFAAAILEQQAQAWRNVATRAWTPDIDEVARDADRADEEGPPLPGLESHPRPLTEVLRGNHPTGVAYRTVRPIHVAHTSTNREQGR